MEEYEKLQNVPAEIKSLYRYAKICFIVFFAAGVLLSSAVPIKYFVLIALAALAFSTYTKRFYSELLTSGLKTFFFSAIPTAGISTGYAFAKILVSRFYQTTQG